MRKLKWREVGFVKALVGDVDKETLEFSGFPEDSYVISKPYIEAGLGVENIFKVVRVDFVWRLSYLDHPGAKPFGVRASLQFDF